MKTCRPHLEKLVVVWGRRRKEEAGVCRRHSAWARSGFFSSRGTERSLFQAAATTALNEQLGWGGRSAAGTLLPLHVLVRASQSKSFPLGCLVLVVSVYQTNLRLFSSAAHRRKKKSIILEIEAWNGGVPIRSHLNAFTIIIFLIIACFWYIREKSQSP